MAVPGPRGHHCSRGAADAVPLRQNRVRLGQGTAKPNQQAISFIQVNLNKTRLAQTELLRKLNKLENYIALITEPYCYKQKLCILPRGDNCLPQNRSGHPRACILSSKHLKVHEINELKHRDMAIGMIKLDGKSTVIISLYMDIKTSVQTLISPALEYCQQHGYGVLIGTDTNAHHTDWGLSINERGKELEVIIDNYNLVIQNRGRLPTYECKLGSSIIDVTMSSRLPMRVDNWRVKRSFNGSDHNTIQYQLIICLLYTSPSPRD